MNWKRAFSRIGVVVALAWFGVVGANNWSELTGRWVKTDAAFAHSGAKFDVLEILGQGVAGKLVLDGPRLASLDPPDAPPSHVTYEPNLLAAQRLFEPPLLVLLAIGILVWIGRGFRKQATSGHS